MFNIDELRSAFTYKDGKLYWKKDVKSNKVCGKVAGSPHKDGYWQVQINGKKYLRSRIVFFIHHGFLPEQVDHINRDRRDDRIENLREADNKNNSLNSERVSNGRNIVKKDGGYQVIIGFLGKKLYCGFYKDEQSAISVRDFMKRERSKFYESRRNKGA